MEKGAVIQVLLPVLGFSYQCHLTISSSYSYSFPLCSYRRRKWATLGNFPPPQKKNFGLKEYFHFFFAFEGKFVVVKSFIKFWMWPELDIFREHPS